MAFDTAEEFPRRSSSGIRGMDNLETGIRGQPKRISGSGWIRADGAISKVSYYQDLVRAWLILFIAASSSGVAFLQIIWGHW